MIGKVSKIALLFVLILIISCENDNTVDIVEDLPTSTLTNEAYGTDAKQQFDIYLPAGRSSNTPVLILIHGGFWTSGDKADLTNWIDLLRPSWQDYAIVNTNYRLATGTSNKHPSQVDDIASLVSHLESQKNTYQISSKYYMLGISAGAHLGLLYSYQRATENKVKAVCSIVGPTDFTDPYYTQEGSFFDSLGSLFLGATFSVNPAIYEDASPVTHVDSSDPPTRLYYGGLDELVPTSQPQRLMEKLTAENVYFEYTLFEESGHTLETADLTFILSTVKTFFDTYQ